MKKGMLFQISIYLLSLALLAALYSFAIIPKVRKQLEVRYNQIIAEGVNNYVPVLVYKGEIPLLSGVIITEVNRENFKIEKMPIFCLVNNAVSDFDMINEKELKFTITNGQQISFDVIGPKTNDYADSKRLKEFKVISLVGERVRKGAYIDILARYPDGSYDLVIEKIRVYEILHHENVYIKDKNDFYTILLAVDEDEFRRLTNALLIGNLDTRLYLSEKVD